MDEETVAGLGRMQRRFTYDKGGVGLFLLGIIAAPLPVLGIIAAVALPLTVGRGQPLRGTAGDVFDAALCLLLVATFGYFLWSAYQVSPYRTAVFTVYERGLVRSSSHDPVHDLPAASGSVISWTSVVEVAERRGSSRVARWMLPPNLRYRAAVAVDEGWALLVTGATKDAPELVAMVRDATGLPSTRF
jgi:hypothetical protein